MLCFDGNNKKPRIYWLFIAVCFFLVYFTYGMSLDEHFAPDTYAHLAEYTTEHIVQLHFGSGRYVAGLLVLLMDWFGVQSGTHQYIGVAALLVSTAFSAGTSCYLIYTKIDERSDYTVAGIAFISVLLMYINPFLAEWFLFPEAGIIFAFSLLFLTVSCLVTCKYQTLSGSIIAIFFLYLGFCCYQAILPIYIIFSILYEICGSGCVWSKKNVIYVLRVIMIGLAATILSVYLTRIINEIISLKMNERSPVFSIYIFIDNMWWILRAQAPLWLSGMGTMPAGSVLVTVGCLLLLATVTLCGKNKEGYRCVPGVIFLVLFLLGIYIMVFSPMYFTASAWLSHRIFPSFMMLFTVLGCVIASNKPGQIIKVFTGIILVVFLCININSAQRYQRTAFAVNEADKDMLQYIADRIEEYELESGCTVEYVAYVPDEEPGEVSAFAVYGDACKPVRSVDWCFQYAISLAAERDLNRVEMDPEIMEEHFEGKNYSSIHEDQFVFEGDTLYLLIY